jgi:hypothetical protein
MNLKDYTATNAKEVSYMSLEIFKANKSFSSYLNTLKKDYIDTVEEEKMLSNIKNKLNKLREINKEN